jgi:hypothetical protein
MVAVVEVASALAVVGVETMAVVEVGAAMAVVEVASATAAVVGVAGTGVAASGPHAATAVASIASTTSEINLRIFSSLK